MPESTSQPEHRWRAYELACRAQKSNISATWSMFSQMPYETNILTPYARLAIHEGVGAKGIGRYGQLVAVHM